MDIDIIIKKIQEGYDGIKSSRNNPYYRGCNDVYIHPLRVIERDRR